MRDFFLVHLGCTSELRPDKHSGLRKEVRQLQDANKALSLYINKIVERVIAHEGFENVLATDYTRPSTATSPTTPVMPATKTVAPPLPLEEKPRPPEIAPVPPAKDDKASKRRTISIGAFAEAAASIFSSTPKSPPLANSRLSLLKPMLLSASVGPSSTPGGSSPRLPATPIDEDDEEDAQDRERLKAELALMGIDEPGSPGLRVARHNSIVQTLGEQEPAFVWSPQSSTVGRPLETVPFAAIDTISSINERDRAGISELKQGRASGFTEPRRMNSTRRRDGSGRSSNAEGLSAPTSLSRSNSYAPRTPPATQTPEEESSWSAKALKRFSMSAK